MSAILFINSKDKICEICGLLRRSPLWIHVPQKKTQIPLNGTSYLQVNNTINP